MMFKLLKSGFLLSLVGCAGGSYVNTYNADMAKFKENNLVATGKRIEAYSKQVKISKATLVRGGKSSSIDLGTASFQRGDKVFLEEGNYGDISKLNTAGVSFVGKGLGKTIIGSSNGNVLKVDGTSFQDLTLISPQFHFGSNQGIRIVGSEIVGAVKFSGANGVDLNGPLVNIAFSDLYYSDLSEKYPNSPILYVRQPLGSDANANFNFSHKVPARSWRNITETPEYKAKVVIWTPGEPMNEPDRGLKYEPRFVTDYFQNRGEIGADFQLGKMFYPMVPMFFKGQMNNTVYDYDTADTVRYNAINNRKKFERQTEMVDWTTEYLKEKYPQVPLTIDSARVAELKAKAEAAASRGHKLVAVALYMEIDKVEKYINHAENRKKIESLIPGLKETLTCGLWQKINPMFPNDKNLFVMVRRDLSVILPLVDFGAKNSKCNIDVGLATSLGVQNSNSLGKILKKEDILEKSAARKQRDAEIAMEQAAAARAREKAQMAKFASAGDRGKEIAQKMVDGRVRTETAGNQKLLVYGSGNFGSHGNVGTNAQIAANSAAAASAQGRADSLKGDREGDFVKVGEKITQEYSETSSSNYSMDLNFNINGKKFTFKGPLQTSTFTRNCTKVSSGTPGMGIVDDCKYSFGGRTDDYSSKVLAPYIESYLQQHLFKVKNDFITAGISSTDPEKKFEAYLWSIVYGYGPDEKTYEVLSQQILGVKENKSALTDRLFTAIY